MNAKPLLWEGVDGNWYLDLEVLYRDMWIAPQDIDRRPGMARYWFEPTYQQNYAPLTRKRDGVRERRCSRCGAWKPLTAEYFRRDRHRPLGLENICKACRIQRRKIRERRDASGVTQGGMA